MIAPMPRSPRFRIGDYVRVIRSHSGEDFLLRRDGIVGRVVEVDESRLLAHYVVEFYGVRRVRFSEFDLIWIAHAVAHSS